MDGHRVSIPSWRPLWAGIVTGVMSAVAVIYMVRYVSLMLVPGPYQFWAVAILSLPLLSATAVAVLTVWFLRRGGQRLFWVIVAVGLLAAGLGYAMLQNT